MNALDHHTLLAAGAALISAAAWGFGSLLFKRLLADSAESSVAPPVPAALNLFKNTIALLVVGAFWLHDGAPIPQAQAVPWIILSGLLGFAIGDSLYMAALPLAGVQTTSMLGQLHVPMAALGAFVFTGHELGALAMAGMGLVLAGVFGVLSVVRAPDALAAQHKQRGVLLAMIAAVVYAANVVIGHHGMQSVPMSAGAVLRVTSGMLGAFLIAPVLDRRGIVPAWKELVRPLHEPRLWKGLFVASFFGSALALPLFHHAMKELDPGVAAVLFSTTPLFTLPLGLVMGERHRLAAWAFTLLGFAGVALVVAGS